MTTTPHTTSQDDKQIKELERLWNLIKLELDTELDGLANDDFKKGFDHARVQVLEFMRWYITKVRNNFKVEKP